MRQNPETGRISRFRIFSEDYNELENFLQMQLKNIIEHISLNYYYYMRSFKKN